MKGLRKKKVGHPILCEYIGGSSIEDVFLFFILAKLCFYSTKRKRREQQGEGIYLYLVGQKTVLNV